MDNGHDEANLTTGFTFYLAAVSLYSFINKRDHFRKFGIALYSSQMWLMRVR